VLRALERTPELRYQTIGEMRTQVMTVVNEPGPAPARSHQEHAAPRQINVATSYVSTPEQLATFDGQFFLYRRKTQMLLDDSQLSFTRAGTTTFIPLAAITDLSIGRYPRVMNPLGLDFISVSYDEGGQTRRLFFSPSDGLFGTPWHFNRFVTEWFDALRAAVTAATGRTPGNTPADQLGTPSSSLVILLALLVLLLAGPLLFVFAGLRQGPFQGAPASAPQPTLRIDVPPAARIPGEHSEAQIEP
jgi:hypothetical protein